jgi:hypothetical protein
VPWQSVTAAHGFSGSAPVYAPTEDNFIAADERVDAALDPPFGAAVISLGRNSFSSVQQPSIWRIALAGSAQKPTLWPLGPLSGEPCLWPVCRGRPPLDLASLPWSSTLCARGEAAHGTGPGICAGRSALMITPAFVDDLVDSGFIVLGGPLQGEREVLIIVSAPDEDAVRQRFAEDPWVRSGMLTLTTVERWTILLDGLGRRLPNPAEGLPAK